MDANVQSQVGASRGMSGEGWAAVAGVVGSAVLLVKKLLGQKAPKAEPMSRADFYAEMSALKDYIHAGHLAVLEKLDANHRELLAVLERQAGRLSALETAVARVDERTKE
jgi:hypothetical protein